MEDRNGSVNTPLPLLYLCSPAAVPARVRQQHATSENIYGCNLAIRWHIAIARIKSVARQPILELLSPPSFLRPHHITCKRLIHEEIIDVKSAMVQKNS